MICSDKSPEDDDEVKEKDIAQKDSTGGSSTEDSAPTIVVEQRSFCTFCKKSMESLLLHLVTMHKDEEEVKKILLLRKGSVKNKPLAADKSQEATENRGKGKSNKGKVGRQPQKNNSGKLSCPICKKSFSKLSLRQHYVKCNKSAAEETKSKLVLNKRVTAALYSNALPTLRDKIFPACRDDAKGIVIKTDELLIQYGNDLVKTFKNLHQHGKIREKLRAVANFFNKVRGLDKKINSFRKIFHPKHLQNAVTALNICGSFNVTTGKYDAPSNVQTLGTYVKQIGAIALREYKNNPNKTQEVESFLQLWQKQLEVIAPHVPQTKKKKKMNSKICDVTDVKLLWNYLYKNRMDCYQKLRRQFSCDVWRQLAEYTLTSIIVFCKLGRIGELERLPVSDLGWDDPTHPERLVIRNSLPQTVPVLQDRDILNCIGSVVSNRAAAGVDPKNPYAFGIPSRALEHRHLIASVLLPNYAEECGAAKPEVLRSTQLRQHFITFLSKKNIKEWELCDLANFLKRAGKISKRHLSTKFRKKPQDKKLTSTPLVALETLTLVTSDGTLKPVTSDSILPLVTSDSTLPLVTSDSTLPLVASDSTLRPIGRAGVLRAREEQPVRRKFREYSAIAPAIKSPKTAQAKSRVDRNNRSTKSKIQRTTWQPSENLAIRRAFKYYFRTFKLPTLEECEKSRQLNRALEGRTAIMIKAHVNNEINRMKRGNDRKT